MEDWGLYYDQNRLNGVFDSCRDLDIDIKIVDEYVYCDTCKTLVNTHTCPHGQHHHVHYHSESIMNLDESGYGTTSTASTQRDIS